MKWHRAKTRDGVVVLWTSGEWSIEVCADRYELWREVDSLDGTRKLQKLVKVCEGLDEARTHAKETSEVEGVERKQARRGRPSSPNRCEECGASPAHQTRTICPPTTPH